MNEDVATPLNEFLSLNSTRFHDFPTIFLFWIPSTFNGKPVEDIWMLEIPASKIPAAFQLLTEETRHEVINWIDRYMASNYCIR